jgi:hypothetical protein
MAIYIRFEGLPTEQTPLDPGFGWYASAKLSNGFEKFPAEERRIVSS